MAEYTSRHTGLQIDEALDSALNVKQVRGIVKMTAAGPVAAVPGEDFPESSGSTVSVTGLLKGVLNAETGKIEIQQATAGTDYQTPLTAGADYATPSAVANKQNKITAQGLLKGLGDGSVTGATPGEDYQLPIPAGTYATSPASATVFPNSGTALTANTIYAVADAVGTYAFTPPDTGWAHGMFTTGSSVSVSFSGTFMGAAPTIEASKAYEFDVFAGVWAVQEVVSA